MSTIIELSIDDLHLDPERFQFKGGANADTGAGLALTDVQAFDVGMSGVITVWLSPEREFFVVNGHHRVALANATGYRGKLRAQVLDPAPTSRRLAIGVEAVRNNVTDREARTYGALINIAEGRGDALDAAKLMRDTKMTETEMAHRGISLTDKLMAQAAPLSHLDDTVFFAAIYGRIAVSTAVIIGQELPDQPEAQREIYQLTQQDGRNPHQMNYVSDARLLEYIRLAKGTETVQTQVSLFGPQKESLLSQKAELLERVKSELRKSASVFGNAVRHSGLLATGGTVVDRETGQRISRSSAAALDLLNRTAYSVGTAASDILNRHARRLAGVALASYAERREIAAECFNAISEVLSREADVLLGEEVAA